MRDAEFGLSQVVTHSVGRSSSGKKYISRTAGVGVAQSLLFFRLNPRSGICEEVSVPEYPDTDPQLVAIENAIDVHGRVRENSVDRDALNRASQALADTLKAAIDDPEKSEIS